MKIKLLVLCTVSTGLDAISTVLRCGYFIKCIVGVHPNFANRDMISGYVDISVFAKKWNIPYKYVRNYELTKEEDIELLSSVSPDLVWVAGWQRLIPEWLIGLPKFGAIGGHGSPEGISGGRGRSPQNWAIMLGTNRFDLALFKISPGIDDGPVILEKYFFYNETDDISISYKKTALCMGEMVIEILKNPELLQLGKPQKDVSFYYPQRRPEDGYVDWHLKMSEIVAHCRALTRPYPGLRSKTNRVGDLIIWHCALFDNNVDGPPGMISHIFEDSSILVNCSDGRLLLIDYVLDEKEKIVSVSDSLISTPFSVTMQSIIDRHRKRYPELPISSRIINLSSNE